MWKATMTRSVFFWINTIEILKPYQILEEFFILAKLNGGRRSSATLTEMKRRQNGKGPRR